MLMGSLFWRLPRQVIFFFLLFLSAATANTLFPVPETLKDNVAFWIRIYTEIPETEGLLHDRDYPLIVYEKIDVRNLRGRKLNRSLDNPRKKIALALKNVRTENREFWGPLERRVDSLFRSVPGSKLDSAEYRIRFQLGQRDQFLRGLIGSGALIDTIRAILDKYGVPRELSYLPHVESSFNPLVLSKAGAAGIWQFMTVTARQFQLKVDKSYDERKDPILSTYAAARLLANNYSYLKNWPLAITAYNYGLPGLLRAVENVGSNDPGTVISNHKSSSFRFASKNFYACFLAALEVAENYSGYFGGVVFEPKLSVRDLFLSEELKPAQISRILGISSEEFFRLNPAISTDTRTFRAGTVFRVSGEFSEDVVAQRVAFYYDSLSVKKNAVITAVSAAKVFPETTQVLSAVFDAGIYDLSLRRSRRAGILELTVLPNETIGLYAEWLDVSQLFIERLNGKKKSIKAGQKFKIPVDDSKRMEFEELRLKFHRNHEEMFFSQYKIAMVKPKVLRRGENLWTLCRKENEIPVWLLRKLNRDLDLEKLLPGTVINFPVIVPL